MQALLKTGFLAAIAAGTFFGGLATGGDDTTPPEAKPLKKVPTAIAARSPVFRSACILPLRT